MREEFEKLLPPSKGVEWDGVKYVAPMAQPQDLLAAATHNIIFYLWREQQEKINALKEENKKLLETLLESAKQNEEEAGAAPTVIAVLEEVTGKTWEQLSD